MREESLIIVIVKIDRITEIIVITHLLQMKKLNLFPFHKSFLYRLGIGILLTKGSRNNSNIPNQIFFDSVDFLPTKYQIEHTTNLQFSKCVDVQFLVKNFSYYKSLISL